MIAADMLAEAGAKIDELAAQHDQLKMLNQELQDAHDRQVEALHKIIDKQQDVIRAAINHLQSYRYCDDLDSLQHEVGMVITGLQRA